MVFDPITLLSTVGVSAGARFVYNFVLAELKKDETKAWVKDVLQDWLKDVAKDKLSEGSGTLWEKALNHFGQTSLEQASETVITAFLLLVDRQLGDELKLSEAEHKKFQKPLRNFVRQTNVREILGSPLSGNCDQLDIQALKETLDDLGLRDLPDDFDWFKLGQEYLTAIRKVLNESTELKQSLDFQGAEKDSKNLESIANIAPEFDLSKYQETVRERYGNLKLESIDSSGYTYDGELKIHQIFIPQKVRECQEYLPQVYELPKERQIKLLQAGELDREIEPEELERLKRAYTDRSTQSVLDVINDQQNQYLVILGDPGSGKSTLLQYLAVEWARLPVKELVSEKITIAIELRDYIQDVASKNCQNFLEFIHKGSRFVGHLNQHQLDKQLKQGKVRVLFDGLDEVFDPQQRDTVIKQIHSFTQSYDQVKVIVTSRIIGYKPQQLKDAEFKHFMLQDLEPEQIEEFLTKWHDLTYKDSSELQRKQERQQRITKAVKESTAIQQLAGNPLLLTMMAILNRNQNLPRDRAKLYERSSELLLYQWDVEAKLLEDPQLKDVYIDYSDKQAMLREVAHFIQASDQGLKINSISKKDLERVLIKYLKTIDVPQTRKVAHVMIEQLRTRNFILCDIGGNYYAFVHSTFLEYFCAWSYIWQFEKTKALSIKQLKTEVYGQHWQDESWHEVLRLIAGMLEAQFVGEIIEYLMEQDGESEKCNNLFLAAGCLGELKNFVSVKHISDRLKKKIKKLLSTICQVQPNHLIEYQIISKISSVWKQESDTLTWLKNCANFNPNLYIQESAVLVIAKDWQHDPDTLPWIKDKALSDDHYDVRMTAIRELAKGWRDDPETFLFLKQKTLCDYNQYVRITTIEELAKGWRDDPETFLVLKQKALSDNDKDVRKEAIQELAKCCHNRSEIFEFLFERAVQDPFIREDDWQTNPRQTALEAILEYYPNHPKTKDLLEERSQNDPDEQVRKYATKALEKLKKQIT